MYPSIFANFLAEMKAENLVYYKTHGGTSAFHYCIFIFIPLTSRAFHHWELTAIEAKSQTIHIYDSLHEKLAFRGFLPKLIAFAHQQRRQPTTATQLTKNTGEIKFERWYDELRKNFSWNAKRLVTKIGKDCNESSRLVQCISNNIHNDSQRVAAPRVSSKIVEVGARTTTRRKG